MVWLPAATQREVGGSDLQGLIPPMTAPQGTSNLLVLSEGPGLPGLSSVHFGCICREKAGGGNIPYSAGHGVQGFSVGRSHSFPGMNDFCPRWG